MLCKKIKILVSFINNNGEFDVKNTREKYCKWSFTVPYRISSTLSLYGAIIMNTKQK